MRYLLIIILLIASPVFATDYYLDSGVGTSGTGLIGSPWKETTDINWSSYGPGDTLYVSGGATASSKTYSMDEAMNFKVAGGSDGSNPSMMYLKVWPDSAHNGVVIFDGGDNVYLTDNGNRAAGGQLFDIRDADYLTIDGEVNGERHMRFQNWGKTGNYGAPNAINGQGAGTEIKSVVLRYLTIVNDDTTCPDSTGLFEGCQYNGDTENPTPEWNNQKWNYERKNGIYMSPMDSDSIIEYNSFTGIVEKTIVASGYNVTGFGGGPTIRYNTLRGYRNEDGKGGPDGISSGSGTLVHNNTIWHEELTDAIYNPNHGAEDGIQIDRSDYIKVYNNLLYGYSQGPIRLDASPTDGCEHIYMYNNVLMDSHTHAGLTTRGIEMDLQTASGAVDIKILNNTIAGFGSRGINVSTHDMTDASGIEIKNNIMYDSDITSTYDTEPTTPPDVDYNLVIDDDGPQGTNDYTQTNEPWDSGGTFEFTAYTGPTASTNTTGDDLTLVSPSSMAIGAGVDLSTYFTDDYEGAFRGAVFDIGAYEYAEATGCDCASTDQANPCEGQTISVTVDGGTPNGGTAEDQVFNWAFNSNSGDARCGQFANGDYWIAPASGQTEVNVTAITTTSAGTLRADADPVMEGIGLLTGTRDYGNYDADEEIIVDLPIAYSGTNSLVAAIQRDEATNGNCGTSGIVGECVDAYNVVTILASVPAGAGSTVLRPNITGESKVMLSLTDFDFTRLPDSSLLDGATTAEFEEIRQRWSHSTEIFGLMSDGAGYSEGGRAFRSHQVIDDYGAGMAKRFNDDLMTIFSGDDPLSEKQAALAAMMAYGLDLYHGRYNGPGTVTRAWGAGATQSPGKFLPAVIVGSLLEDTTYLTTLKTASTYIHDSKVTGPHELAQVWPGVNNPVWGDGTTLTGENMHGGYWGALHIDNCYDGHTGSCAQDDVYDEHKPTGAKTQKDPYGYIDGPPNEAGSNYMPTSLGSQRAMVFASFLMPEICEAINYPDLAEYVVRVDSYGLKTAVDPCMTPDTRENKTWNTDSPTSWFWESTCDPYRNTGCVYYSGPTGTWGPIDPDNDDSGCIEADTNATVAQAFIDGYVQTGRFAALDGDAKTPGYSSAQVETNWETIVTSASCSESSSTSGNLGGLVLAGVWLNYQTTSSNTLVNGSNTLINGANTLVN